MALHLLILAFITLKVYLKGERCIFSCFIKEMKGGMYRPFYFALESFRSSVLYVEIYLKYRLFDHEYHNMKPNIAIRINTILNLLKCVKSVN